MRAPGRERGEGIRMDVFDVHGRLIADYDAFTALAA